MKKLFGKSFLALVLAMTMIMGMSVTAMAEPALPTDAPKCTCTEHPKHLYVYGVRTEDGNYDVLEYEGSNAVHLGIGSKSSNWEVGKWYDLGTFAECTSGSTPAPTKPCATAPSHTHSYE